MPEFVYRAKRGPSETVMGSITAENTETAITRLLEAGISPIDIRLKPEALRGSSRQRPRFFRNGFGRRISRMEVAVFIRQLSDLTESGLPVLQSLSLIGRQTRRPVFHEVIGAIAGDVGDGSSLSQALARHPKVFSDVVVSMVRSGEIGGTLAEVLEYLADTLEQDQEVQARVAASLIYPGFILSVGTATIFVLLTWVIPRIVGIFDDLGETLPLATRILMGISFIFARFWWAMILVATAVGLYTHRKLATQEGRLRFDRFVLGIPIAGDMIRRSVLERFARTLGTLIRSGVDIVAALEAVQGVCGHTGLKRDLDEAIIRVRDGSPLTEGLKESSLFSETALNLISIGETSGELASGLLKLAQLYGRQTQRTIKVMTSLIEPVLILVLGAFVGFIVLAMLMPIFRMNLIIQ